MSVGSRLVRSIKVKFEGDTRGLDTAFSNVEKGSGRLGKVADHFDKLAKSSEGLAVLGVSLIGVREKITDSVDAASSLNEQLSKSRQVFGSSSQSIVKWSKHTAAFGVARNDALEYTGVLGNMLVPMGVAQTRAAGMSKKLVKLAADLGSFNDADPTQVLEAIRSGLSGESEPLRQFGVFLSAARIKAEAMSEGLVKATKNETKIKAAQLALNLATEKYTATLKKHGKAASETKRAKLGMAEAEARLKKEEAGSVPQLNASQKALATYGLILKDTKAAQGDFARTSNSLANSQRVNAAQSKNLQTNLGQLLLPAVKLGSNLFGHFTSIVLDHGRAVKILGATVGIAAVSVFAFTKAMSAGKAVAETFADAQKLAGKAVKFFREQTILTTIATKAQAVATGALNLVMAANPFVLVAAALVGLGIAFYEAWKHSETFRRIVKGVFAKTKAIALDFVHFFTQKLPAAFRSVLTWLRGHWKEIAVIISGPFAPLVALATGAFGIRSALKKAIGRILGDVKSTFQHIGGFIKDWAGTAYAYAFHIGSSLVSGIVHGLGGLFTAAKNAMVGALSRAKNAVLGVFGIRSPSRVFADEIGKPLAQGIVKGYRIGMGDFMHVVSKPISNAIGAAHGLMSGHGPHGIGGRGGAVTPHKLGVEIGEGIRNGFNTGLGDFTGLVMHKIVGAAQAAIQQANRLFKQGALLRNIENSGPTPHGIGGVGGAITPSAATKAVASVFASTVAQFSGAVGSGAILSYRSLGHNIPLLGDGGIVTKRTLAVLGERSTPEAVIPLRRGRFGASELHVHFHGGTFVGTDKRRLARELVDEMHEAMLAKQGRNVNLGWSAS